MGTTPGVKDPQLVLAIPDDDAPALAAALNRAAAAAGIVLAEVHVRRPTLEASYLRLLEGDPR